jgi:hypothetical protein
VQAQNSGTSPSPATGNTQILTSGRNLQLFVSSSETQTLLPDNDRRRHSLLSDVHVPNGSRLSWESSGVSLTGDAAVDATSTTPLRERSRAQLLNIVPDVDSVRVTSVKSQVGLQQVVATKLEIPQLSSVLIKAEQTDLNRPYLGSVQVEGSAADFFEIAALPSETTSPENDQMHVDHPLTPAMGDQRMPPLELLTPVANHFTVLQPIWSTGSGDEILPSTLFEETSSSPVVGTELFHRHQTSSSLLSTSNYSMNYSITIAIALLSFSILLSTSKVCCLATKNVLTDILIPLPRPSHHYFSSSNI